MFTIICIGQLLSWMVLVVSITALTGTSQIPRNALTLRGPIYLPSTNSSSKHITEAKTQSLSAILDLLKTGVSDYGTIDNQTTSFSASVFSTTISETLFEFHFEGPELNGSYTKGSLSENTIYRTGSLGKLFMVYQFLVDIGDGVFLDPLTKYIVSYQSRYLIAEDQRLTFGAARAL
jgi:hypothetical protein